MLSQLRKLFRTQTSVGRMPTALEALAFIRKEVERKNVAIVADDIDAGYDMAIDEIIDVIEDYEKALQRSLSTHKSST